MVIEEIAKIENGFDSKFGIPRQSGLVEQVVSRIVFAPKYRNPQALQGLDGYSHLWLIWEFSKAKQAAWSPMVRPPRLGGNQRMGVFATRSPFRPNSLGLSCVKLLDIVEEENFGMVIYVSGADLMNGTPIYDIKPYLPYVDSHPEASNGFAAGAAGYGLEVKISEEYYKKFSTQTIEIIKGLLAQDPRPAYQQDEKRIYGFSYEGLDIRFRVEEGTAILCDIVEPK